MKITLSQRAFGSIIIAISCFACQPSMQDNNPLDLSDVNVTQDFFAQVSGTYLNSITGDKMIVSAEHREIELYYAQISIHSERETASDIFCSFSIYGEITAAWERHSSVRAAYLPDATYRLAVNILDISIHSNELDLNKDSCEEFFNKIQKSLPMEGASLFVALPGSKQIRVFRSGDDQLLFMKTAVNETELERQDYFLK